MKVVELEDFTPLLEPEKEKEKRREKGESLTVEEVESVYRKKSWSSKEDTP